ncbi:Hypothetical protein FKW44_003462 [Caligus rogercresseyi]|uniref:Uncharacterized protein n=1 Tax=Caligus rogercresseyi TaxID=217165 RepID=A0A7T8QX40_CALRO|nr:Hypothetical protein FKW44_003462 [Caligus rogercresseyi]
MVRHHHQIIILINWYRTLQFCWLTKNFLTNQIYIDDSTNFFHFIVLTTYIVFSRGRKTTISVGLFGG